MTFWFIASAAVTMFVAWQVRAFVNARTVLLRILSSTPDSRWWKGIELARASGGAVGRADVYHHLQSLEEDGLVRSREVTSGPVVGIVRREYQITEHGRKVL